MSRTGDFVEALDHHAYRTGQPDFAGEDQPHRGPGRAFVDPNPDIPDTPDTYTDTFSDTPSRTSYVGSATQYLDPQKEYQQAPSYSQLPRHAPISYTSSHSSYSATAHRQDPARSRSPFRVNHVRDIRDPHPRAGYQRNTSRSRSLLPVHNRSISPPSSYSGTAPRRRPALQASPSQMSNRSTSRNSYYGAGYQENLPRIILIPPPRSPPPLPHPAPLPVITPQSFPYPVDRTTPLRGILRTEQVPSPSSVHYTSSGPSAPYAATQETRGILGSVDYYENDAFTRHEKAQDAEASYAWAQKMKEPEMIPLLRDLERMKISPGKAVRRGEQGYGRWESK
ncbi:hypothetical protein OCU04_009298 [Sclerotinia nivalis]|uniref:Uncharacterized protein n=1 Tax=Sclerotinia nivalis TaxID=352851 RepID=A0A9X0AIB4_9HELO|nr:hypothetical protein OCU04_009298 [Sclerotinia nivalis]